MSSAEVQPSSVAIHSSNIVPEIGSPPDSALYDGIGLLLDGSPTPSPCERITLDTSEDLSFGIGLRSRETSKTPQSQQASVTPPSGSYLDLPGKLLRYSADESAVTSGEPSPTDEARRRAQVSSLRKSYLVFPRGSDDSLPQTVTFRKGAKNLTHKMKPASRNLVASSLSGCAASDEVDTENDQVSHGDSLVQLVENHGQRSHVDSPDYSVEGHDQRFHANPSDYPVKGLNTPDNEEVHTMQLDGTISPNDPDWMDYEAQFDGDETPASEDDEGRENGPVGRLLDRNWSPFDSHKTSPSIGHSEAF
jgi:hypothetical protein